MLHGVSKPKSLSKTHTLNGIEEYEVHIIDTERYQTATILAQQQGGCGMCYDKFKGTAWPVVRVPWLEFGYLMWSDGALEWDSSDFYFLLTIFCGDLGVAYLSVLAQSMSP
jgi:hypothetical protein